jgi:hypothetical protein
MKLAMVSAHTIDFYHFFKIQYAMMRMYDPEIKITVAKSDTLEQFTNDVDWVDLEFPDFLHPTHRNYTTLFNFTRGPLAQSVDADRVAWVDADILPLVPNAISNFMTISDKPTVAHNVYMSDQQYADWDWLTEWYGVGKLPCYNCGLVTANRDDSFWNEWADAKKMLYLNKLDYFLNYEGSYHYGIPVRMFFIDQIALNYVIDKDLDRFHYVDSSNNWQPLDPNGDVFKDTIRMPFDTKILHLSGPSKKSLLIDKETINVQTI